VSMNVDAAFNYDTRRGLTGVVIRDHNGKFIAGSNRKIEHVLDPLISSSSYRWHQIGNRLDCIKQVNHAI
jgi:hypothetical protein